MTVYVAHAHGPNLLKVFMAAQEFGTLREVFMDVPRNETQELIDHARSVMFDWKDGDSVLLIGDPALCGVCMAVAAEYASDTGGPVRTLNWNRIEEKYWARDWNFNEWTLNSENENE